MKATGIQTEEPKPPLDRVIREGGMHFCDNCNSTLSKVGFLRLFGERLCDNEKCPNSKSQKNHCTETISCVDANEKLSEHFFKRMDGVSSDIHKVANGYPLYYNKTLKKWRVSSLAFIWGHEEYSIDVKVLNNSKVSDIIKNADIDWNM